MSKKIDNTSIQISIYLDQRRKKKSGAYPVKLRVYNPISTKTKLFPTVFDFSEEEFHSIWLSQKPRKEAKEIRLKLQAIEQKANEVLNKMRTFSFESFEKKLFQRKGAENTINHHYEQRIKDYSKNEQVGTESNYNLSLRSLMIFNEKNKGKAQNISFHEINEQWLNDYESYMLKEGKSISTVGIYLRPLRAIFNSSIENGDIESYLYPFGKRKFQIPSAKSVKKALSQEDLKKLFQANPKNKEQATAKDFWFFSYSCSGMNIKDIALLRYSDIKGNEINYFRAKTKRTSKSNLKPITIFLNDYALTIIKRYGKKGKAKDFVFDILEKDITEVEAKNKINNFTRFINQHIKLLASDNGITSDISTYWARHSFATSSIRNGASIEFISEALNHSDIKTTKNYFAGFEDKAKKEFSKQLMNF